MRHAARARRGSARAAILTRPCKVYGLETPERIAPPAGAACPPCGPRGGALRNDRPDDTEMIRSWCARCIMCIWDIIIQSPLSTTVRARGSIISSTRDECQADGQGRWQRRPVVGLARQPGSGVPSRPRQWKGGTADTRRASFPLCGVQKKGDRRRRAAAACEGTDSPLPRVTNAASCSPSRARLTRATWRGWTRYAARWA